MKSSQLGEFAIFFHQDFGENPDESVITLEVMYAAKEAVGA